MSADLQFFDTNVLVYLFDNDSPLKQAQARKLFEQGAEHSVISPQVLGEFYVAVTRKLTRPLSPDIARDAVEALCTMRIRQLHGGLVRAAIARSMASQISYWDGLIVETAIEANAGILLTEDLQHGQMFAALRVENPFIHLGTAD